MRFPELSGRSLAGRNLRIPGDLAGETNVLLLAFRQRQQRDIDHWITALGAVGVATSPPHDEGGLPILGRLAAVLYELPLLGARWLAARAFIDGGMASNIADPAVLARTVTVYGQIGAVERALHLPTRDQVYAVVEREGAVAHISAGWPGDVAGVVAAIG